jgi:hypothetical protein
MVFLKVAEVQPSVALPYALQRLLQQRRTEQSSSRQQQPLQGMAQQEEHVQVWPQHHQWALVLHPWQQPQAGDPLRRVVVVHVVVTSAPSPSQYLSSLRHLRRHSRCGWGWGGGQGAQL